MRCRNLSYAYGSNIAVDRVNFSVEEGDYLFVIGENGSGKSTLLRGLLGLERPFDGDVIRHRGLRQNELGYMPQQTSVQKDFPAGVFETVISGRLGFRGIRPFYTKEDRAEAHRALELLGIQDLSASCYRELSGGQRQRVLLARTLCAVMRLKILFLDEPVSGLAPDTAKGFYEQISRINREDGVAVVMVSHDMQATALYGGKILRLQSRQVFRGTGEQ
jgi:zinc transport system ATP-binding protein